MCLLMSLVGIECVTDFCKASKFYLKQYFYEYFILVPQCKFASISLEHITKSYIMQNFTFSGFGKTKLLFKYYTPTTLYMCFIGLCPSQHLVLSNI